MATPTPNTWDFFYLKSSRNLNRHSKSKWCYGTTTDNNPSVFNFKAPKECLSKTCKLRLELLHSWNKSYVGNTDCEVTNLDTPTVVSPKIIIEGDRYPVSVARLIHTIPISTEIGQVRVTYNEGSSNSNMWALKCVRRKNTKKNEENLLTCITKISIMMAP